MAEEPPALDFFSQESSANYGQPSDPPVKDKKPLNAESLLLKQTTRKFTLATLIVLIEMFCLFVYCNILYTNVYTAYCLLVTL